MWALTRFAHAEFWKAFRWRVGTAAARDFLWLSIFFVLLSFLVFFALSARQGLWQRFEQVLLGALPPAGSPVRVNYHFIERTEKITPLLIGEFQRAFPDLSIVPMRRFDGVTGTIVLPGYSVPIDLRSEDLPAEDRRERARKRDRALSWGLGKDSTDVPLKIFALPLESPIWRWIAERAGSHADGLAKSAPMVIAASTTLFSRHFRYDKYRDAVLRTQAVPCPLRSAFPAELKDPDDPSELTSLVLEVNEGFRRTAYHAFDVVWINSFPLPDSVAVIMPLPTVELLIAAESREKLELHLESHGQSATRVHQVWLRGIDEHSENVEKFRRFAACLGAAPIPKSEQTAQEACHAALKQRADCEADKTCVVPWLQEDDANIMITAADRRPLRRADVARCAAQEGLGDIFASDHPWSRRLKIDPSPEASVVAWAGPGRVSVPCDSLVPADYEIDALSGGNSNARCREQTDEPEPDSQGTAWLPGYPDAMVYANEPSSPGWLSWHSAGGNVQAIGRSPSNLKDIVTELVEWKPDGTPVFTLDPAYQSALVRFGVLSTLVERVTTPIGLALVVLYFALAYVILATAFWHRRAQYGLLALNGLRRRQLVYIASFQILLACLVGCAIGYGLCLVAVKWVNQRLADTPIIQEAGQLIGLDVPNFLNELTTADAIIIWLAMSALTVVLGCALMVGVWRAKAPIDLVKS
jgi:FtsX-like permease family protein